MLEEYLRHLVNDIINFGDINKLLEFRHKFHHRIPFSIEVGLTEFISRQKKQNGHVTYTIGGTQPISLNKLVNILKDQYIKIIECFKEYQNLVMNNLMKFLVQ